MRGQSLTAGRSVGQEKKNPKEGRPFTLGRAWGTVNLFESIVFSNTTLYDISRETILL